MKTALATGVSGQDGWYLAQLLLAEGYKVVGTTRDRTAAQATVDPRVELADLDMGDDAAVADLMRRVRPSEVYNLAAYTSGAGMFDDPTAIGEVNGIAVVRILEAIRTTEPSIRFCQASSSEVFGDATISPQTESAPFNPRSPYGAAKLYADQMVGLYRKRYGLFACSAILFNHESPRRGLGFVTRKVSHAAASIRLGRQSELRLGNLDSRRDWGFAGDYMRGQWLMLRAPAPGDYVLATGETHSVRELCDLAFAHLGMDYRDYVREDIALNRPPEALPLVGDPSKAMRDLNWTARTTFPELVRMMVDSDLAELTGATEREG